MWPVLVDQIVGFMLIHTWFTAAVLLTNANYVGSGIMAFTITPPLLVRSKGVFTMSGHQWAVRLSSVVHAGRAGTGAGAGPWG